MAMKRCPECLRYFEQIGDWQRICKRCFGRSKHKQDAKTDKPCNGFVISLELMKKLRQLVHPDRHGGSQLANSVMAELNKLMGR